MRDGHLAINSRKWADSGSAMTHREDCAGLDYFLAPAVLFSDNSSPFCVVELQGLQRS